MAPKILSEIEAIPHTVYVEPFAGGAALLFAKKRPTMTSASSYREVLNDTNELVTNFYRVAIKKRAELELELKATLYSQADYREAVKICKNPSPYTDLEKAWAFYVNITMSFAKGLNKGWGTGVLSENQAATWKNRLADLGESLLRVSDVHVSCEDALDCIRRWDSPHTLFYCDPPYPNTEQGHYKGYTLADYKKLCDLLDGIQGSYILSNYPQEVFPQTTQKRLEFAAQMSALNARQRTDETDATRVEVLWICDRSGAMRSDVRVLTERVGLFGGEFA
jgi:DNA adenine methylase